MRAFVVSIIAAALPALGVIAAACGGDELTVEEYFRQFETLDEEVDAQTEALVFPGEQEFASEEEELEAFRDYFEELGPIIRDFVERLDDINPPAELERVHNEAVDAGRDVVEVIQDDGNRVAEAESVAEAEAAAEAADPDAEVAFERFDDACHELQGVADDNGIDVDLCD